MSAPGQAPPLANGKTANPPNQTLYCTNIPDKLQKYDLKRALYILFSTYGSILDVVTMKTMKMRGQAHIVFKDIAAATQAMRDLQGFEFFGKEMKIEYGKGRSNIISRLEGTANVTEQRKEAEIGTNLQRSIFTHPSQSTGAPGTAPSTLKPAEPARDDGGKSPQGVKRPREDSDNEPETDDGGGEASMDEDDEGEDMDVSD